VTAEVPAKLRERQQPLSVGVPRSERSERTPAGVPVPINRSRDVRHRLVRRQASHDGLLQGPGSLHAEFAFLKAEFAALERLQDRAAVGAARGRPLRVDGAHALAVHWTRLARDRQALNQFKGQPQSADRRGFLSFHLRMGV